MRPTWSWLPLTLLAGALAAGPAHAGWGDALKQQANKVIKHEKKPATNAESGPVESRIDPKVTPENLKKFRASLELEIAERDRITRFRASLKTEPEYEKCKTDWMLSPDGQKLSQKYVDGMNGKSQPELQKHFETVGGELQKAIEKHCGPDPAQYGQGWVSQELRNALGKASDQFTTDDYAYGTWKEWITEFCNYISEVKKQPDAAQRLAKIKDEGLRVPGSGAGIYYVYTASEATALLEQCESLMPLIAATL
jgi:hypothetical protein